jgi:Ca2+-binding EF-hand superfamily protein
MADGDPEFQTLMDSEGALIKPVFVFFDTDSDGCLTAPEVISVLTMLGYAHPGVGFETKPKMDFKQMMLHIHLEKKKSKQKDVEIHIRRTFHMIDKQYRGKVRGARLHRLLRARASRWGRRSVARGRRA